MEKNVKVFIDECAKRLGESQSYGFISELEMFEDEGYGFHHGGIKSPIEQILFAAVLHNIKINDVLLADPETIGEYDFTNGIEIVPQCKIGKYIIDFRVTSVKLLFNNKEKQMVANESKTVFVECDSQEWHERTEKERRYEKARDRYFAKRNFKVFHYTGKEIIKTPYEIAAEILGEILGYNCDA